MEEMLTCSRSPFSQVFGRQEKETLQKSMTLMRHLLVDAQGSGWMSLLQRSFRLSGTSNELVADKNVVGF
ncbi:unnamed protein product [Tetraodon nigroviridis]|uniref:(spotted green pufferfish) hypothetical protein n=1 Tax=Tetraodon nigroviridis TaxID=99883 RepID=Q4T5U9_TETNG|nr:unnamed protein product [Tetraodon nigroviridis]